MADYIWVVPSKGEKPSIVPCVPGETSDGYHTFDELYDHRCLLFAAIAKLEPSRAWRSRLHDDGNAFDGWFIAGMNVPVSADETKPITYHLPDRLWDLLEGVPIRDRAPEWDGHTSVDVLARLKAWIEGMHSDYVFPESKDDE